MRLLNFFFAMFAKEEGGGGSENSGKIRYLRRNVFVDDPLVVAYLHKYEPRVDY